MNGDKDSIDNINSFGPIKFNALLKMIGINVKSCNLFNTYLIGSKPRVVYKTVTIGIIIFGIFFNTRFSLNDS